MNGMWERSERAKSLEYFMSILAIFLKHFSATFTAIFSIVFMVAAVYYFFVSEYIKIVFSIILSLFFIFVNRAIERGGM